MKPERVTRARVTGNVEALSAMGKKGAEVTKMKKDREQEISQVLEERQQEIAEAGAAQMAEERRDDLIPEDDR